MRRFITLCSLIVAAFLQGGTPALAVTAAPGYYAFAYASGYDRPTCIAFGPDGTLFATLVQGTVVAIRDTDANGFADTTIVYAEDLTLPLGMAWRGNQLYISSLGKVTRFEDIDGDHVADTADTVITGLPYGRHQNTGLAFDESDRLYVSVGSVTDTGEQPPLAASILRYQPDGAFIDVMATGLRNPFDLAFSKFGFLLCVDNSPGVEDTVSQCFEPPDELNVIWSGRDYGFPDCLALGDCADMSAFCSPVPCGPGDCDLDGACDGSVEYPQVLFDPHSAPTGITFTRNLTGFPENDLMVALFGQTVPVPGCPTNFGHKVVHVPMTAAGYPYNESVPEDFVWDLETPIDLAVGPDDALYVADYTAGTIYRVIKSNPNAAPVTPAPVGLRVFPNPARHGARVVWTETTIDEILVVDVAGRERRAVSPRPGAQEWTWDLRDQQGNRVPAGIYWVRARGAENEDSEKLLVLD